MTILCPTDFSPTATTASRLALRIAAERGYHVHVLHAYQSFQSAFQGQLNNRADEERTRIEADNDMARFISSLESSDTIVPITSSLSANSVVTAVNSYVDKNPVALIVMGTEGAKGVAGSLTGSNSYYLAKDTTVPILIVPEGHTGLSFSKSMFFTDYQPDDVLTLNAMKSVFGNEIVGGCTLVHITAEESGLGNLDEEAKLFEWKSKLEKEVGVSNLKTMIVSGREHVTTVNNVLSHAQVDLTLITVVGGRGFFERLTKKSLARAIILNPEVPILLINQGRSEMT